MKNTNIVAAGMLAAGLLVGGFAAGGAGAPLPAPSIQQSTWPPPPQSIVNISSFKLLGPNEMEVIYTVPADSWLVVTDADKVSSKVAVGHFGIVEGGVITALLNATDFFDGYHSATGFAFPPGSEVAVGNGSPSQSEVVWWDVTGYLVR